MQSTNVKDLEVPGAKLHYEVTGQGPVLLLICGGPTDAAIYAGLAGPLSENYTVVSYDPRGNSRSSLDGTPQEQQIEAHSDDAHRLLAAVTDEPAYVFGSSGGALVGLDLVARHPEQVKSLVVHEPPVMELLPDSDRWREHFQDVYDTYQAAGVGPAMQKFIAGVEGEDAPPPAPPEMGTPSPEMMEMMGRMAANAEFFVGNVMLPFSRFTPDAEALKSASTRIVCAAGEASKGQPVQQAGLALADSVGAEVVDFPGDHQGFLTHSAPFAEQLRKVLAAGQ
ncbi:alpha/beta fold hydrolase [Streptomyces sp. NPDC059781]|uniref:alpha/beta fold hydrolase n=1 Tax=unclassified Streptomyces TaxID=2593676 RepID=UPI00364C8A3E